VGTGHHRIDKTFTTSKRGSQTVWVFAINTGSGSNVLLECKTITVTWRGRWGLAPAIRAVPNSIAASFAPLCSHHDSSAGSITDRTGPTRCRHRVGLVEFIRPDGSAGFNVLADLLHQVCVCLGRVGVDQQSQRFGSGTSQPPKPSNSRRTTGWDI
jgi:hypothetical protein